MDWGFQSYNWIYCVKTEPLNLLHSHAINFTLFSQFTYLQTYLTVHIACYWVSKKITTVPPVLCCTVNVRQSCHCVLIVSWFFGIVLNLEHTKQKYSIDKLQYDMTPFKNLHTPSWIPNQLDIQAFRCPTTNCLDMNNVPSTLFIQSSLYRPSCGFFLGPFGSIKRAFNRLAFAPHPLHKLHLSVLNLLQLRISAFCQHAHLSISIWFVSKKA